MNEEETVRLIEATLDKIRPFLQRDGGDVDYIGFRDGIVYVTMVGACQGCSFAQEDISAGVEIILMEEVPGVIAVKSDDIPEDIMADYLNRKVNQAQ
ncbi:MAG: NifU family protein [Bacilli bacterium]|nr:NifU family protein [Bacilli bacterium]MBO6285114.1 NifU family protein [Bacilli bacterium]